MAQPGSDSAAFIQKASSAAREWPYVASEEAGLRKIVARDLMQAVNGGPTGLAAVVATFDAKAVETARDLNTAGIHGHFAHLRHESGTARGQLLKLDEALGRALEPVTGRPHARDGDGFAAAILTQRRFFPDGPSAEGFASFTKALPAASGMRIVSGAEAAAIGSTQPKAGPDQLRRT